jgi:uncharacterized membrane protein
MDANDASADERGPARLDLESEPTVKTTPEPGDETASDTRAEPTADAPTAALPADQPQTAALPAQHAATEQQIAEPPTPLSTPEVDEVGYEPEPYVAPSTTPFPAETTTPDADVTRPHGPRMRTVVLGLVLLAISGTGLLRMLTHVQIDDTLVLLTLLIVAGALLLAGGVASAAREARGGRRRS